MNAEFSQPLILVVEDETSISDSVAYALGTEGFRVACVGTAHEALSALKELQPQLIVLDIGLPDTSGIELCKHIRSFCQVPIVFLTARTDEIDRIVGLEIGGDDYVVKPFSPRELVARVKAVLRRTAAAPVLTAGAGAAARFQIDPERMRIVFQGKGLELSRYEFKIVQVLLGHPGRVYTREHLMELIWEEPGMSLERTVDAHIKSIRAKLRAIDPDDDSIVTHRGFGYSLREGT